MMKGLLLTLRFTLATSGGEKEINRREISEGYKYEV